MRSRRRGSSASICEGDVRPPLLRAVFDQLYDPISAAFVPLIDGLSRRMMLRRGMEQRGVRLSGIPLNYYYRQRRWRRVTAAMPILLIHGIGDSAATWALVEESVATLHDVYAVDLPGHGFSGLPSGRSYATVQENVAALTQFIAEVIGRPALLVGNSLGGLLAVRLASTAPQWVAGAVLINPGGALLDGKATWDPFFAKLGDSRLLTAYQIAGATIGVVPTTLLIPGLRGLQQLLRRRVILDAYAVADETSFLTQRELADSRVPLGLIWGLKDHFLPPGSLAFFDGAMPGNWRLYLRMCGHLAQRERPLAVARFVHSFAMGAATAAGHP